MKNTQKKMANHVDFGYERNTLESSQRSFSRCIATRYDCPIRITVALEILYRINMVHKLAFFLSLSDIEEYFITPTKLALFFITPTKVISK